MGIRRLATPLALTAALAVPAAPAVADLGRPTSTAPVFRHHHVVVPPVPKLVGIRAGAHPAYTRLVFDLRGAMPSWDVRYVTALAGPSGRRVAIPGRALLRVVLDPAAAHAGARPTAPVLLSTLPRPLVQVRQVEDFEAKIIYGVGLSRRAGFRAVELTAPNRLVIDIAR